MMRVLLISPVRGIDPPCGDIVHTETLLMHPPAGVEYETYADALNRGALIEHANRSALARAWKTGTGRWSESWMTVLNNGVNLLRRARWLFWEPFRIFSLRPGEYDLVHVHAFDCGFRTIDCPLLMGGAIPMRYLYTEARHYSMGRTRAIEWVERLLARVLGVNLIYYWIPQVRRIIALTAHVKAWYLHHNLALEENIDQVPIYLPSVPPLPENPHPTRVGFIAQDFDAKGGPLLLEAFILVRESAPDVELLIVGSDARLSERELEQRGITWLSRVPREQLMAEILPTFDVFAYPTQFDGMPLVLLEAMSHGIAIASTDYRAIPEMLDYGRAGLISPCGDASALAGNILRLFDPEENAHFRRASRQFFDSTFSAAVVKQQLLASYLRSSSSHRAKPESPCLTGARPQFDLAPASIWPLPDKHPSP